MIGTSVMKELILAHLIQSSPGNPLKTYLSKFHYIGYAAHYYCNTDCTQDDKCLGR